MNWLKKLLGYHICEKFTTWEKKDQLWVRDWDVGIDSFIPEDGKVHFTTIWQERKCQDCGKFHQETLRY